MPPMGSVTWGQPILGGERQPWETEPELAPTQTGKALERSGYHIHVHISSPARLYLQVLHLVFLQGRRG